MGRHSMLVFNSTKDLPLRERVLRFKEIRDLAITDGSTEIAGALTSILEGLRQGRGSEAMLSNPFTRPSSSVRGAQCDVPWRAT